MFKLKQKIHTAHRSTHTDDSHARVIVRGRHPLTDKLPACSYEARSYGERSYGFAISCLPVFIIFSCFVLLSYPTQLTAEETVAKGELKQPTAQLPAAPRTPKAPSTPQVSGSAPEVGDNVLNKTQPKTSVASSTRPANSAKTPKSSAPAKSPAPAQQKKVAIPNSLSNTPPSGATANTVEAAPLVEESNTSDTETTTNTSDFYNDPFAEKVEGPSFLSLWLRLMGILLAFGILAYVVLRVVKSRQKLQMKSHPLYQVVASFPLAVNKTIKIVKVIQDYYVLVISQDTVTLLKRLEDKASIDEVKLHESGEQTMSGSIIAPLFGDVFKKYSPFEKKAPLDITRHLREKLKKL